MMDHHVHGWPAARHQHDLREENGHREDGDGGQHLGQVCVPQWGYLKASSWVGARACLVSDRSYAHVQPVGTGSAEKGKPQRWTDKGGWVGARRVCRRLALVFLVFTFAWGYHLLSPANSLAGRQPSQPATDG